MEEAKIEQPIIEQPIIEQLEKKQHYRITVSRRGILSLRTVLNACGKDSLEMTEPDAYVVITTKTIAEKLKTDNDWVVKVELFPMYHIRVAKDE